MRALLIEFGWQNRKEEGLKSKGGALAVPWVAVGGHLVNFNENPQRFLVSKEGPVTKAMGAAMHQGCTRDAPRRHQGGTKDAFGMLK